MPAEFRRIDPSLQLHRELHRLPTNSSRADLLAILRTSRHLYGIGAFREHQPFAAMPVPLLLKEEIGSQPLGLRRVHPPTFILYQKPRGGGSAVTIPHLEYDLCGRSNGEENIHFVAEAQVLRPLTYVELQLRFPLARNAGIELQDAVLHFQARQHWTHRLLGEKAQFEKSSRRRSLRPVGESPGARAFRPDYRGHTCLAMDLDQKRPPPSLQQLCLSRSLRHLHPPF